MNHYFTYSITCTLYGVPNSQQGGGPYRSYQEAEDYLREVVKDLEWTSAKIYRETSRTRQLVTEFNHHGSKVITFIKHKIETK